MYRETGFLYCFHTADIDKITFVSVHTGRVRLTFTVVYCFPGTFFLAGISAYRSIDVGVYFAKV